ncbi:MAG: 1-acyl-sn-glycerol-3-phosphate acyltransferase [Gammaproteobacteria bacterium]|nr:1-acyl-sn-glycerol-3-phosphate acyltransferase [Gammaproteobacteria bacterium]
MNKQPATAAGFIRSSLFSIVFVTTIPIFALLTVLCFPFPFKVRYAIASRWALLNLWWLKHSCGLSYRVSGAEHIPRETAIIFSKHQSTWETLALQAIFQLITQGRQRLEDGRWVVVFPEGTRITPGQKGRYRIGGAILAEQSGHPIVPVAHNAGEFWPRKGFIKRPGEIQVVIGPAIPSQGRAAAEILKEAETWIEDTMAQISNVPKAR